jgi:hypothetical protein
MALTDAPQEPPRRRRSGLEAVLPYTTVVLIIVAGWVAWIFYQRHQSNVAAQRALQQKQEEKRKQVVDEVYGSGEIRFLAFSADSGLLRRGESTELCYGVVNATTLKLNPPVEPVKPSYHHCLEIAPKTTTTYTLTADDGKGHTKSESLTVRVR